MAGYDHKERMVLSNILLDEFICREWDRANLSERKLAQHMTGKLSNLRGRIDRFSLDKKLLILTALNKRFLLLLYDNNAQKVTFEKMQKVFNHYITTQANYESEEARKEMGVFVINERQAAKQFFIGAYRFAEPLYKIAEDGTAFQFMSQFKTPAMSISKTEQKERNLDVYCLLMELVERGYFLDEILVPYKFDFGHFVLLGRLFRAEKPLTQEVLIKKHKLLFAKRSSPSTQKLNDLLNLELAEKHTYEMTDNGFSEEELEETQTDTQRITLYNLTSKGMATYTDIVNKMMSSVYE